MQIGNAPRKINDSPVNHEVRSRDDHSLFRFKIAIWILCIIHGLVVIVATPLWEGWDEAFHYSYVQGLVEHVTLPVYGKTVISGEVATSFKYAPLSLGTNRIVGSAYTTFEQYWKLAPDERRRREQELHTISSAERSTFPEPPYNFNNYEAQHPPLFYFIAGALYALLSSWDLPARVFFLRLFALLLGSVTIVLSFSITRYVWSDTRYLAVVPLLLAVLPLFYSTVAHVSNDSLGVPLFSALVLLVLRYFNGPARARDAVAVGIVLGLGLLTKAYFLTALPAVSAIFLVAGLRQRQARRLISHLAVIALVSFVIAGWWYLRNYSLYGNFSGMQELTLTANLSPLDRLRAAKTVPWFSSITAMLQEHIWVGNNSSLRLSRTIYRIGYLLIGLSIIGFIKAGRFASATEQPKVWDNRRTYNLVILQIIYICFLIGVFYHTLVNFILVRVSSGTGGWYLYAAIIPEVVMLIYGFEAIAGVKLAKLSNLILILYALTVDLLSVFCKSLPAYAGFFIPRFHIQHLIGLYSPSAFTVVLRNLSINRPGFMTPAAIGLALLAYMVCLTLALILFFRSTFRSDAVR